MENEMNPRPYRISDISVEERPREKMAAHGASVLSDSELIAILLRTGIQGENAVELGKRLLLEFGGIRGIHQTSLDEFRQAKGIGLAKASQIKAAIELGRRLNSMEGEERPVISTPGDVVDLVQYEMLGFPQEHLWVLLLNTKNQVFRVEKIYKGTLNSSTVRIAELFRPAITRNAAAIVLVHNHPSGDPTPSSEDVRLTRSVVQSGKLLDIEVLDHIIIGGAGNYASLKQKKLGF
jgi:DNA repair protein RadC